MMGYRTPNIDRIAEEGALFTHHYAQQTCTAGRSAFILGQEPFRTGLTTVGLPGSPHGIQDWMPTLATALKDHGYATGQVGKNHLGDQDHHLPTEHGFDEFFGNLYHLNSEEEPETYHYPQDPEFREKYGPRGVLKSTAGGEVIDTGPLTRKRMETADEEFLDYSLDFIDRAVEDDKPFFLWHNTTRMHMWTRLSDKWEGSTGLGLYPDGMAEHDYHVGQLLDKLDELGIADNTIIIYSSDNGAQKITWPDAGTSPFMGDKATTFEGGYRVPQLVRWPGVIEPGTQINAMMSHKDWFPTLMAALGDDDIKERLASDDGTVLNDKHYRVHLDGYNFLPFFKNETQEDPREIFYYFSPIGEFNGIRWGDFKLSFAEIMNRDNRHGHIIDGTRRVNYYPAFAHLKSDPFETARLDSAMHARWSIDQIWTIISGQHGDGALANASSIPKTAGECYLSCGTQLSVAATSRTTWQV
ncbi:choline-sulfatase [Vibrio maritimus]|uniref:Choline-sulfatase n=1 Tax=Vibrio maritimus TaxID=990268 RepID=A0A090RTE3_9VIBR|nr:choline-sulfatase [Vibrio maritimus]